MSDPEALEERASDLTQTGRQPPQEAPRVVNEVLSFLAETPGIDRTRWATHGEPNDGNARPDADAANRYAFAHSVIIENAPALRAQRLARGMQFRSETDSEVLAHFIAAMPGERLEQAVHAALQGPRSFASTT